MNCASLRRRGVATAIAVVGTIVLAGAPFAPAVAADPSDKSVAEQIFDAMVRDPGIRPGHRVAHAKGIVCEGSFAPSADAMKISTALHFQHGPVPVTIRFSDGPANPFIADNSHDAGPWHGRSIQTARRRWADGRRGHIAQWFRRGHRGGVLALLKAAAATNPDLPHPWPIEAFLASHPRAMKFVQDNAVVPASFGTEAYFSEQCLRLREQGRRETRGSISVHSGGWSP